MLAAPLIRLLLRPASGPGNVGPVAENFWIGVPVAFTENVQVRQIRINTLDSGIGLQTAGLMSLRIWNLHYCEHRTVRYFCPSDMAIICFAVSSAGPKSMVTGRLVYVSKPTILSKEAI